MFENMSKKITHNALPNGCKNHMRAIYDTLDIVSGKWKIAIITSLTFGKKRFMELQRDVEGIGAKMLSKELQDLEVNELVLRTVYDTKPVTVEYELTEYGHTLQPILFEMVKWGYQHRERIVAKSPRKTGQAITVE
eukprot:gene5370-6849_t